MNLEDLLVFQEVAKAKSMTKAAEKLNFVQSNVTAKIKRLESRYNTRLFYRHKHGVTLTSSGQTLLFYSKQILRLMDEAEKTLKYAEYPSGKLCIGSIESTVATRLPELLSKYHESWPKVELSLQTGTTESLIHQVLNREMDGAFVAGEVKHPELESIKAFEEELMLISKHPVSGAEHLQNQTIIVFKSGCYYREMLEEWLKSEGIKPSNMMELNTLDGVLGCVRAGLGISLLTRSVVEQLGSRDFIQYPLPHPYQNIATRFIHHKDVVKTPAFNEFKALLTGDHESRSATK